MKKITTQLILFVACMFAYIAIMVFGFFWGSEYPMLFFGAIMMLVLVIFIFMVRPKVKDALILLVGVVVGVMVYEFSNWFVNRMAINAELGSFVIKIFINAPVFFPTWNHFLKTLRNSKLGKEIAEEKRNRAAKK